MDQAVKAGIKFFRIWGFRDLNVTHIPGGVSGKSIPFGLFAESELSATTASPVRRGRCRALYDLLPKLGERRPYNQ